MYGTTVIPNRGAWIEYETDLNDVIYARVDRTRKLPATVLLRAMGLTQNEDILALFNNHPSVAATLERDTTTTREEALIEIYKSCARANLLLWKMPPRLLKQLSLTTNVMTLPA